MNEGEDPNNPIISDNNSSADNSDNGVTIGGNGKAITATIAAGQSATRAVSKDRAARMERNDNLNKTEEQVRILQGVR